MLVNKYIVLFINVPVILGIATQREVRATATNKFGIKIPETPCPEIFLYKYDHEEWYAEIIINSLNIVANGHYTLQTNFSIGAFLTPSSYIGDIQLIGDEATILEQISQGRPLQYKVYFPYENILPYLKAIVLNGQIICIGTAVNTLPRSTYYLSHTLRYKMSNELSLQPLQLSLRSEETNEPMSLKQDAQCDLLNVRQYPWLVSLYEENQGEPEYICTGHLISMQHVLTAAECVDRERIILKLGSHNTIILFESDSIVRFVKNVFVHPDYNPNTKSMNIAIILLNEPIKISTTIRPICLWPKNMRNSFLNNKLANMIGWPINKYYNRNNEKPSELNVTINPTEKCNVFDANLISEKEICTARQAEATGICLKYSGGGLIMPINNNLFLRGILSISTADTSSCTANNFYAVFTDLVQYYDWIQLMQNIT